jgi:hypothetical protein
MQSAFLRNALVLGMLSAVGPFAIDMYLPAFPQIERDLSAPPGTLQLTLSLFLAGLSIGQFVIGPISDRTGRRLPLLGQPERGQHREGEVEHGAVGVVERDHEALGTARLGHRGRERRAGVSARDELLELALELRGRDGEVRRPVRADRVVAEHEDVGHPARTTRGLMCRT